MWTIMIATWMISTLSFVSIVGATDTTDAEVVLAMGEIFHENDKNNRHIRGGGSSGDALLENEFRQDEALSSRKLQIPRFEPVGRNRPRQADGDCSECNDSYASSSSTEGDSREDIFNQLNVSEYISLVDFALSHGLAQGTMDSLVDYTEALNTNYIVFAQLFDPPKLAAIDYLDGVTSSPPKRFGILTIHRGAERPRDVMVHTQTEVQ
jgi:hypothetical protein